MEVRDHTLRPPLPSTADNRLAPFRVPVKSTTQATHFLKGANKKSFGSNPVRSTHIIRFLEQRHADLCPPCRPSARDLPTEEDSPPTRPRACNFFTGTSRETSPDHRRHWIATERRAYQSSTSSCVSRFVLGRLNSNMSAAATPCLRLQLPLMLSQASQILEKRTRYGAGACALQFGIVGSDPAVRSIELSHHPSDMTSSEAHSVRSQSS